MKKKLKYLISVALMLILTLAFTVSASAEEGEAAGGEIAEENVFDKIYTEISEYAGEILCAMTFVGSIVLAFAYKKGLLPILKGSLVSIGNAVSKMKDSVSESTEKGAELGKSIENSLNGTMSVLETLTERIDTLEKDLAKRLLCEDEKMQEKEAFKIILRAQIDMLYDIFMSSAIPQYQKDAVGEKIARMKGALPEYESTN